MTAVPNETLLIGAGANAVIENFSLAAGDKLDLTYLLNGAALASDLSNLGAYVTIQSHAAGQNGGTSTVLSINGPGGSASLTLGGSSAIELTDLIRNNALVLPQH